MIKKAKYQLSSFFMKNIKVGYYFLSYFRLLLPRWLYRKRLIPILKSKQKFDSSEIEKRVNYYNKLEATKKLNSNAVSLSNFRYGIKPKPYFFDSYKQLRYFSLLFIVSYLFGDITIVPDEPSLVKSRPIGDKNENSILLKLNAVRHFNFVNDRIPFSNKKNILLGRSKVYQTKREIFLEKYFNHPLCDVGQVNDDHGGNKKWLKPKMTLAEHLNYKFILCLEGNDVATNLKWVMSSNSIAVMPRPTFETWFMEGTLIPGYHYIEIAPDYSNLEEKLKYYIEHTREAEEIIEHAHEFILQFQNRKKEKLISLLVLQKYFEKTGQTII